MQMRFQPLFAPYQVDGTEVKDIHGVLCDVGVWEGMRQTMGVFIQY